MTMQRLWDFYLEAKALIERSPIDVIILPEVYKAVECIAMTPVGFDVAYVNQLIASIPPSYREQYEAYGLHFNKQAA